MAGAAARPPFQRVGERSAGGRGCSVVQPRPGHRVRHPRVFHWPRDRSAWL